MHARGRCVSTCTYLLLHTKLVDGYESPSSAQLHLKFGSPAWVGCSALNDTEDGHPYSQLMVCLQQSRSTPEYIGMNETQSRVSNQIYPCTA
ncbi:hypothetical protein GGI35DRAFT_430265 [Trichoderma velutinum]